MLFKQITRIKTFFLVVVVVGAGTLTGCATSNNGSDHLIPQEGLTVSQIYAQSGQGESAEGPYSASQDEDLMAARAQAGNAHLSNYSTSSNNHSKFQLISNPNVPIYIYPHLVSMGSDEVPVDGYETAFFLYTQNHYALPWERY